MILHNINNLNSFNISFSLNRLVDFLRKGEPFIVLENSDLNSFISEKEMGIFFGNQHGFKKSIIKVMGEYQTLSLEGLNSHNIYLDNENLVRDLLNDLNNE